MNFEDVEERDGTQLAVLSFLTRQNPNNHFAQVLGCHGTLGRHPELRRRERLSRLPHSTRLSSSVKISHQSCMSQ